jgi:hypothetical protein
MPQLQVLRCPSCGANLTYAQGSGPTITCQFCGTNVVLPAEASAPASREAGQLPGGLPPDKVAQIRQFMRAGKKLEAIKLYRQLTNVGLDEAKAAVERLLYG